MSINSKFTNNILVTGGCGYIGSHVVRRLSLEGYNVVVLDNLSTGFADSLLSGEKLIVADLTDAESLNKVFETNQFDAVIHFAGRIVVPESVERPLDYYNTNTAGTINLLRSCEMYNVDKVIFSSTAAVYGNVDLDLVTEENRANPTNPYGYSKLMSEQIIQDYSKSSPMRYLILRYFNVAGANPSGKLGQRSRNATHLIKVASEVALGLREYINIFGNDYSTPDGTAIRDYIHIEDLASAHTIGLKYLINGGESSILNCGYGHGFSVREVLSEVGKKCGHEIDIRIAGRRPGDVPVLVADSTKIRNLLGWNPEFDDLGEIVGSALNFERKHRLDPG